MNYKIYRNEISNLNIISEMAGSNVPAVFYEKKFLKIKNINQYYFDFTKKYKIEN